MMSGSISHRHIDGLFSNQNAAVSCHVRAATPRGPLAATVELHYAFASRKILITALAPVSEVLAQLPSSCPGQGDSLDGLLDDYFTPGFSFDPGFGPERWFTSQTVAVALSAFHDSRRIAISLSATRAGTPPTDCAVPRPAYEHCSTGGSWSGLLMFSERP